MVKSTLVYAVSATSEPHKKDDLPPSPRSVRGSVLQIGLVVPILYSVNVLDFQRLEQSSCNRASSRLPFSASAGA